MKIEPRPGGSQCKNAILSDPEADEWESKDLRFVHEILMTVAATQSQR